MEIIFLTPQFLVSWAYSMGLMPERRKICNATEFTNEFVLVVVWPSAEDLRRVQLDNLANFDRAP